MARGVRSPPRVHRVERRRLDFDTLNARRGHGRPYSGVARARPEPAILASVQDRSAHELLEMAADLLEEAGELASSRLQSAASSATASFTFNTGLLMAALAEAELSGLPVGTAVDVTFQVNADASFSVVSVVPSASPSIRPAVPQPNIHEVSVIVPGKSRKASKRTGDRRPNEPRGKGEAGGIAASGDTGRNRRASSGGSPSRGTDKAADRSADRTMRNPNGPKRGAAGSEPPETYDGLP